MIPSFKYENKILAIVFFRLPSEKKLMHDEVLSLLLLSSSLVVNKRYCQVFLSNLHSRDVAVDMKLFLEAETISILNLHS
jgi:hypothetical protein